MQMKYLAQSGYQSLSLSEATVYIREKKPISEKAFVMTFDDGYQNNYTQAFPIMQEVGFRGTIFLISAYCEKSWSGDDPYSLKRIDMFYLSNFALFTKLATRKLAWYLRLRQVPRDLKSIMK